jgi:hypothetical protein
MRPQLFVGGLLIAVTGAGLYVLALPLVYSWSLPFIIVGGLMAIVSFALPEGPGPVQPPEGFRFCIFCSTPVPTGAARCPRCNGLQPGAGV